jgi:hypothetical protein
MATQDKDKPTKFFTDIESVRLTNLAIRTAWKSTAVAITAISRLTTAILLARHHATRRNRHLP